MGFDSSVTLYTSSQDSNKIMCDSRFYYKIEDATIGNNSYSLHLSFYGIYNIICGNIFELICAHLKQEWIYFFPIQCQEL